MTEYITIGAATSPVLGSGWTGEAADVRLALPSARRVEGTGMPVAGTPRPFARVRKVEGTGAPVAGARCTAATAYRAKGTGLPTVGVARFGVDVAMGTDQVQGTGIGIVQAVADPGIPPRRGPVRC